MSNKDSIKDTLDVIRRALEDENEFTKKNDNVLILNKKINDDGTVNLLKQFEDPNEVNKVINKKLNDLLEKKMNSILESKLPVILDNYFKKK